MGAAPLRLPRGGASRPRRRRAARLRRLRRLGGGCSVAASPPPRTLVPTVSCLNKPATGTGRPGAPAHTGRRRGRAPPARASGTSLLRRLPPLSGTAHPSARRSLQRQGAARPQEPQHHHHQHRRRRACHPPVWLHRWVGAALLHLPRGICPSCGGICPGTAARARGTRRAPPCGPAVTAAHLLVASGRPPLLWPGVQRCRTLRAPPAGSASSAAAC